MKKAKGPLLLLNLDKSGEPENPEAHSASSSAHPPVTTHPTESHVVAHPAEPPAFAAPERKPWLLADLLRILLILLSLVVAVGFALILLPQPTVDRMTRDLQARRGTTEQEKIAFLYLGDEAKDSEFHIRGVVRNIATEPLEQLDAAVRLYAHDGTILQTTIVRMNKETIAPDEIAQFELVYPNYKNDFMKYSVEFMLRNGGLVSYKDMRTTR